MASGNTALSYQMMIESFITHSMGNAANTNNFYIASAYAKAYAKYLGVSAEKFAPEPILAKSSKEFMFQWEQYYFKMLSLIFEKIHDNLVEIRAKYRTNTDIPRI